MASGACVGRAVAPGACVGRAVAPDAFVRSTVDSCTLGGSAVDGEALAGLRVSFKRGDTVLAGSWVGLSGLLDDILTAPTLKRKLAVSNITFIYF